MSVIFMPARQEFAFTMTWDEWSVLPYRVKVRIWTESGHVAGLGNRSFMFYLK